MADGHDSDETDAPREEDGLRVVPEGYDPQQVHELLAGYKAQMDRLEQVLGSVQAALGASQERLPGEDVAPPDAQALQLAADYRPSTLRFDPTPISMRVSPAAAAQAMRPRPKHSRLWQRFVLEGAFLVLVVLSLSVLQESKLVILAGAGVAWLVVIFVEVLLARLQTRVVPLPLAQEQAFAPAPAPPAAARPEVVALRLPHAEPAPSVEPLLPEEPVDAVTGPDDVWVVPQEVLIAEPVLDDAPAVELADEEEPQSEVVLEDTLETDGLPADEAPAAEAQAEAVHEPEPLPEPAPQPDPDPEPEPDPEPAVDAIAEPEAAVEVAVEDQLELADEAAPEVEAAIVDEPEAEPATTAEQEPEPEVEADPEVEAEPEPVAETELEAEPEADLDPNAEPEVDAEADVEPAPDAEAEGDLEPEPEPLLPHADAVESPEPEWPEEELATDSWEPLFEREAAPQTNGSRRRLFGRRTPEPAPQEALVVPPDPELARATHPLPPVLIDPHTLGNGNGKRRGRRRRG